MQENTIRKLGGSSERCAAEVGSPVKWRKIDRNTCKILWNKMFKGKCKVSSSLILVQNYKSPVMCGRCKVQHPPGCCPLYGQRQDSEKAQKGQKPNIRDRRGGYSVPDANICILLLVLDRKKSEVSKTVWIMSVSITELILQAKTWEKSNQEVRNLRFFFFKAWPTEYTVSMESSCTSNSFH